MTTLLEALKDAQFVTDGNGQQIAVQIRPAVWKALLHWLEATEGGPSIGNDSEQLSSLLGDTAFDASLVQAASKLSEPSLSQIWDNPEDDIYNDL